MKKIITPLILCLFIILTGISKAESVTTKPDSLIRGANSSIYYYASDGFRYVFPDGKTFSSWFSDFKSVVTVSDNELANIPLKGNVTYRPGVRMVKIQTNPKVYAVDKGGKLRWIENEEIAKKLYGDNWNTKIDDIPDVFFMNYIEGNSIKKIEDYNPATVVEEVKTINKEKGIIESASTLRGTTSVGSPTSLVLKNETPTINSGCAKNFHMESGKCICDEGYFFSNYNCISHTDNCKLAYGNNVYGTKSVDGKVGYSSCYCLEGYQWNLNKTSCIKKCPPNSVIGTELPGNKEVCICDVGYKEDTATQGCQKLVIEEVIRPTIDNNYQNNQSNTGAFPNNVSKEMLQEAEQKQRLYDSNLYNRNEDYLNSQQYENRGTVYPFGTFPN